jgi:hypothetical protein
MNNMETEEKIAIIDKVLIMLNSTNIDTVPELIHGFRKYPDQNSDLDRKYRIVEHELMRLELADKVEEGDHLINGYKYFKLSLKGMEFVISKKSVAELYVKADNEKLTEQTIKQLTLEKLEFEKTIRDQEQRIRNLTEKLNVVSLFQKYWWVFVTFFSVGLILGKMYAILI